MSAKTATKRISAPQMYRGVKLMAPAKAPKIAVSRLCRAVQTAIAKNARLLAGGE